jgi:hypothetical protein
MSPQKRTTYGALAAVAALSTLFLASLFLGNSALWSVWSPTFPQQVDPRVFLPPDGSKVRVRFEHYAEDHQARTYTEVEYTDGVSEIIKYWPNNFRKSSERRYPLDPLNAAKDVARPLMSTATYDEKGEKFTSHQLLRRDGTLEREGKRERDGRYHTRYFFEDGKSVYRDRYFDSALNFRSENVYTREGILISTVTEIPNEDKRAYTFFYPTGERRLTYTVNSVAGLDGDFFAVDGKVLSEFHKDYWTTQQVFYDDEGRIREMDVYVKLTGAAAVRLFNADGSPRASQRWRVRQTGPDQPAKEMLGAVDDFCKPKQAACRSIEMSKDGSYPEVVTYPPVNGTRIVKHLNASGQVVSEEKIDRQGGKVILPNSGAEHFDQALLKRPVHDFALPDMADNKAPPYVYDYD